MSYKSSYVEATKRISIPHLSHKVNEISNKKFDVFLEKLKDRNNILTNENSSLSEKIDGFGFRFGQDQLGNFFVESSHSGPVFSKGLFRKYTEEKHGQTNEISEAYESLFETLEKNKKLQSLLGKYNSNGIKVVCECLFTSLGKSKDDSVTFIAIPYSKKLLGSFATFVILNVVDFDKKQIDCVDEFRKLSTSEIKFCSSFLNEYKIDLRNVVESTTDKKELKQNIKNKILECIGKSILGDSVEGLVLKIDEIIVKVVTDEFTKNKMGC